MERISHYNFCHFEYQGLSVHEYTQDSSLLVYKEETCSSVQFSSVQSLSRVRLFATPWITARQASLSITSSRSSPKPMSIESVMPSSHLILCRLLLLLPPVLPSIRVFSNESTLLMRWPILEFQLQHHRSYPNHYAQWLCLCGGKFLTTYMWVHKKLNFLWRQMLNNNRFLIAARQETFYWALLKYRLAWKAKQKE